MKAAVIERQGGAENICYRDFPDPILRSGDVRLRVRACGLNHLDIFVRKGMPGWPVPMPFISGGDIAGVIAELGSQVTGWKLGDRCIVYPDGPEGMMGEVILGGMAEYCRVPCEQLIALPDHLSFDEGACIPVNFGTAHHMFAIADLRAGETVLIVGASGGVGTACVQVAKTLGCRTIACAGGEDKCRQLRELGADEVIDYTQSDFSGEAWKLSGKKGVDLVVNFTGGPTWMPSLRALRKRGRLVTCGATAGYDVSTDVRFVWQRELQILGSNSYSKSEIEAGLALIASGRAKLPPIRTFPLAQLAEAEILMERRDFFGKIVMLP